MIDGTRTRNRRGHIPVLYQLSYDQHRLIKHTPYPDDFPNPGPIQTIIRPGSWTVLGVLYQLSTSPAIQGNRPLSPATQHLIDRGFCRRRYQTRLSVCCLFQHPKMSKSLFQTILTALQGLTTKKPRWISPAGLGLIYFYVLSIQVPPDFSPYNLRVPVSTMKMIKAMPRPWHGPWL